MLRLKLPYVRVELSLFLLLALINAVAHFALGLSGAWSSG